MNLEFSVEKESRLDAILREKGNLSVKAAKKIIKENQLRVNGFIVKKPSFHVFPGDRVNCDWEEDLLVKVKREPKPLTILFEDEFLIAIDKPAGLLSVPTSHSKRTSALDKVSRHLSTKVFPVHRLDRFVSGVLLFAKNRPTQEKMMDLFKKKLVTKTYLALLEGEVETQRGEISIPIDDNRPQNRVILNQGKPSKTHFQVLHKKNGHSLIRATTQSGRRHQVRVHMAHGLLPIVGDRIYGRKSERDLMLFGESLIFPHPKNGRKMEIKLSPPESFSF